ncbi:winged helix-turn-helix domain-containing protein [Dactylosporangium aurantiacum]|uniref:Winged helix-turn-helix domain-containing protein n=1 Tax=Dactylosporangium aurantiacum TaxID=35754 RepID=A0A9Q9MJE1_9ACTN|nr:BTAD domain-containing putative transcriptional regulator [Dactylosporangium aurantiacum]MDG6103877.1 BTAD domain-containing putative transcriptional regulator [Dactylosporangium aurantiacum]UWZ58929.1 winged helix-turn-helix domain-containing protein [Dactylosporangium aurantiacum]
MIHVGLLGPLELRVDGRAAAVGGPGRRALIAALALERGAVVAVPRLVDVIWDDDPPVTAVTKVQGHICALRRELGRAGAAALQTRAPGYRLDAAAVTTDLDAFTTLTAGAARLTGAPHAAHRAELLLRALALWRGPACGDIPAPAIQTAAAGLEERRMSAQEDLAEAMLALHRYDEAVDVTEALVLRQPLRERAWEYLMRGHLGRGRTAAALAAYGQVRRILADELGIPPGHRIRALAGSIGGRPLAER